MYELRPYQQECVTAIWDNLDKHCVASLPTGAGKTPVMAELIRRFLKYTDTHILLLTHKRELIRQNAKTLGEHLPFTAEIGVFCAGLRSKELKQVTIASVQSIVNADTLPAFEIILVDEAHLIPHGSEGQYHEVFKRFPNARILGTTATPYRLNSGMLHEGKDKLFDALVYEAKTGDLIDAGFLSPIHARATSDHADMSDVRIRAGEWRPDDMSVAMDRETLTKAAVADVLRHAADRSSILVFCAGVEHAYHVEAAFKTAGQTSIATVTEKTSMQDRDDATQKFKTKALRILINVGVYTTGFDAPNVDCIVLLRATKSPGLYVQLVGRGLRKAEGKKDCLLLDYGNNIETHGPLDTITAKRATSGEGAAPVKTCPECSSIISAGFAECPHCGYLFPKDKRESPKHNTQASDLDPIKPTVLTEHEVSEVSYIRHPGRNGKPDSMKVSYMTGFRFVEEWVCIEHPGYPRSKASAWFARRGVVPMPTTVSDALAIADSLPWPRKITVRKPDKYYEIVRYANWQPGVPKESPAVESGNKPFDEKIPF